MKQSVGILSRHAVPNYGSILQAIALQVALEKMGLQAEYIDYRIPRDYPLAEAKAECGTLGLLRAIPKSITAYKFESLRRGILKQSRRVVDSDELLKLLQEYPVLCVGGDQVWNVMSDGKIDGAYLLEDAPCQSYKFSYASSFGKGGVDTSEFERVKIAFSKFNKLSVREESGQFAIESMGYEANTVVDPVHLLAKDEWGELIPPKKPICVKSDYCLIYNLHPSQEFNRYAAEACERLDMQVVSIRPTLRKTMGTNLFYPSLGEFLWLFDNANCVLTDSFHGTAFSLLFNTPFVDILPEQYAERNKAILARYSLDSRVSTELDAEDLKLEQINWSEVNNLLSRNRMESFGYLASVVEESAPYFS